MIIEVWKDDKDVSSECSLCLVQGKVHILHGLTPILIMILIDTLDSIADGYEVIVSEGSAMPTERTA